MSSSRGFLAIAIAALAALSSPAFPTTRHDEQLVELAIEAGRLDAMMDAVGRLLHVRAPQGVEPRSAYEPRTYISLSLRRAVGQYNRLMPLACARHMIVGGFCGGRYAPAWLRKGPSNGDSDATLHARVEDASVPIKALWTSVCAHRTHVQKDACEIE